MRSISFEAEMKRAGFTIPSLARKTGLSTPSVSKVLYGEKTSYKTFEIVWKALDLDKYGAVYIEPMQRRVVKAPKIKNQIVTLCCVCMCGCYGYPKCSWILHREPVKGWEADETLITMNRGKTTVHSFKVSTCPQFIQEPVERMNKRGEYRLIDKYEIFQTQQIRQ